MTIHDAMQLTGESPGLGHLEAEGWHERGEELLMNTYADARLPSA